MTNETTKYYRECDGCTKCCEGWLNGSVRGHEFWPGRPCHFSNEKGCSIYKDRPKNPCISYECAWKSDINIPLWMKPNTVNVIVTKKKTKNDIEYYELTEAGDVLDSRVLSWFFIEYAKGNIINIKYQLHGGWNYVGRRDFIEDIIS